MKLKALVTLMSAVYMLTSCEPNSDHIVINHTFSTTSYKMELQDNVLVAKPHFSTMKYVEQYEDSLVDGTLDRVIPYTMMRRGVSLIHLGRPERTGDKITKKDREAYAKIYEKYMSIEHSQ